MLQLVRTEPRIEATELVAALRAEEKLLAELSTALSAQRDSVARNDAIGIETATHLVSRAVLTLDEARRRREQLAQLLTDGEVVALERLEDLTGPIPGFVAARAAVRAAAYATVRDLTLNQTILRGALRAGDAYLQTLFASVADISPAYTQASVQHERTATSGVVVNRRA